MYRHAAGSATNQGTGTPSLERCVLFRQAGPARAVCVNSETHHCHLPEHHGFYIGACTVSP